MPRSPIIDLGGVAQAIGRYIDSVYRKPENTISGINPSNFPTAGQPITPIGPPGSKPLAWPFSYSQNLTYTPRYDSVYSAAQLRQLATYPLARMCIDNAKDILGQIPWSIELRQQPGESRRDVESRRRVKSKGDENIYKVAKMFERPDGYRDWDEWLRPLLEDMLVIDAASILILRNRSGQPIGFEQVPGDPISVYVDDEGRRPAAPSPAYAQLWQGMPRVDLTTDQLVYRPRNIVPRGGIYSSYLYGQSPSEGLATEIEIGIQRLAYVYAYYDKGALSNLIHVVPARVDADELRQAMQWVNAELSGNFGARRKYRIIQGFQEDGKPDQFLEPKEPILADLFDDIMIRKFAFVYGSSAQRLQKQLNRASAQASQQAANEEGIRPWMTWTKKRIDFLIQVVMGMSDYEITFSPYFETDYAKRSKADTDYLKEGALTRNEVREDLGRDPSKNPDADKLMITTPNGTVELGETIVSGKGGDPAGPTPSAPKPPAGKVNGHAALIERGA